MPMTNPASLTAGVNTFTAPADAKLDAGETYFVHVEYTGLANRRAGVDQGERRGQRRGGRLEHWQRFAPQDCDHVGHRRQLRCESR